jgi:hypothetical protein
MSFSFKLFIMFDKSVKKYKWKMMRYYNPFLCIGFGWYGVIVFHHSCICNFYFTELQGHCMKFSSCKIMEFIGWGLAFLLTICHVSVSNSQTRYPDWGFSSLSSLSMSHAGIVPETRQSSSFQTLSNSLLTNHSTTWYCLVWVTDIVIK